MSRAEKNQSPPPSFPITSLPEDVVVDILARVPVCDYPRVSLVSKRFRSLVSSAEIYARRASLGCAEHRLYLVLNDSDNDSHHLYTLRRKDNDGNSSSSSRLVLIPGLPDIPPRRGSYVAVGSRIYVFGGEKMTSSAFFIDCSASHTVQHLPDMPVPMSHIAADVICGRIYVFGFLGNDPESYGMLVFDTETQTWEDGMTKPVMKICYYYLVVVMADKMYLRGNRKSFVYDPEESKWGREEVLDSKLWSADACVVDDVLYYYDFRRGQELRAYDPEHKCWAVVRGLDDLLAKVKSFWGVTVCCGGKLLLFFGKRESFWITKEICCAEISLERRKGGQFWGKVDQWRSDHALISGNFFITKSLDVVL